MFDLTSQQFALLAVFAVFVLPIIVMGIVGLILEVRDRAYDRGFNEAYAWAVQAQKEGHRII